MERTDKFCIAQTWKSKFHVSIFVSMVLLAPLLVMLTGSSEFVGFGIFTLGFRFCCVPRFRSANSDSWSVWVSAAGNSSVSLCHKQELLYYRWYICKGHFSTNFTHSEMECIPAGRSNHDEGRFLQHCTCIALRSMLGMERQCCGGVTSSQAQLVGWPRSLQLLCSSSTADRERVLKPSTQVHWLEGKECCSN